MRKKQAFTIVELMIVVAIVAILALAAVPLYMSRVAAARMSEGITGVGLIRTSLRTWSAGNGGKYPVLPGVSGNDLATLGIDPSDLEGRYFGAKDYLVRSSETDYTIRVTLPSDAAYWFEVDAAGNEVKSF